MRSQDEATARSLTELDEDACWRLLEGAEVGRLGWNSARWPAIIPVNFRVVGREIVLRVSPHSVQGREVDDARVAFEVDELDPIHRTGWSVLVQGHAAFDYRAEPAAGPESWPAGQRPIQVIVSASSVTGRRVG